jgi:hypothetical protein
MRFLFNDQQALDLSLTLVFAAILNGSQGIAEKERIRSVLRFIASSFLGYPIERLNELKIDGSNLDEHALEDSEVDQFCSKDYLDSKILNVQSFSLNHGVVNGSVNNNNDNVQMSENTSNGGGEIVRS